MQLQSVHEAATWLSTAQQGQAGATALLEAVLWRAAPVAAVCLWLRHVVRLRAQARRTTRGGDTA